MVQAVAGWEEIVALTEDKTEQFNIWSRVIQILEKVCRSISHNIEVDNAVVEFTRILLANVSWYDVIIL